MFSIITFNLRFGLADDGPNNWETRKKLFPALFEKYQADFIGFQEANDFQADFLKGILNEYQMIGERRPAPRFWQNNLIFYRSDWECIRHEHFFLSPTPDIPSRSRNSRWPRQCTLGMFEKSGYRLICLNTHFDFEAQVQTESAEIITQRLARLPGDLPALIVGDFNADPFGSCHKFFTGKASPPAESDFKNAFAPSFPGTYHGFTGKTDGGHIDWILYRGQIVPEDAAVIREAADGVYPSDHFPLRASFRPA
jgi:endonuclease/exonuclease/phosphatase family metal-dependent hydrolase